MYTARYNVVVVTTRAFPYTGVRGDNGPADNVDVNAVTYDVSVSGKSMQSKSPVRVLPGEVLLSSASYQRDDSRHGKEAEITAHDFQSSAGSSMRLVRLKPQSPGPDHPVQKNF